METETQSSEHHKLEIWLDIRERDIIDIFTSLQQTDTNPIPFEIKTLDVGDICIVDTQSKEMYIVFERKTFQDLIASMKDGRYKEQKQRILYSLPKHVRKLYILEGAQNVEDDVLFYEKHKLIIDGFYLNNMIRDGIFVEKTMNIHETVSFILKCKHQFERKYETFVSSLLHPEENQTQEYQMFHSIKKKNLNEKIIFKSMLSIIPNVSNSISEALFIEFSSMSQMILFLNQYDKNYSQMIEYISDIKHGNSNKRIGESVAYKIITNLFLLDEEEKNQITLSSTKKSSRKKKIMVDENNLSISTEITPSITKKKTVTKSKKPIEYMFSE